MVKIKVIHQMRAVSSEYTNSTDAAYERALDKHQIIAEEQLRSLNEEMSIRADQVAADDQIND